MAIRRKWIRRRDGVKQRYRVKEKTMDFESKENYQKWLAYGHIHGVFKKPGNVRVKIKGRPHKVVHRKSARVYIPEELIERDKKEREKIARLDEALKSTHRPEAVQGYRVFYHDNILKEQFPNDPENFHPDILTRTAAQIKGHPEDEEE